jgi:hypothetical protein
VPDDSSQHDAENVELVNTEEAVFKGSSYDSGLSFDTTPTSRVEWNDQQPSERRSAYDATMITDTSPTARWEPAASNSGAQSSSTASGDE